MRTFNSLFAFEVSLFVINLALFSALGFLLKHYLTHQLYQAPSKVNVRERCKKLLINTFVLEVWALIWLISPLLLRIYFYTLELSQVVISQTQIHCLMFHFIKFLLFVYYFDDVIVRSTELFLIRTVVWSHYSMKQTFQFIL